MVQLGELVWSRKVNHFTKVSQSGPIQLKFLFIVEFTILLGQAKALSDFLYDLEVKKFLSRKFATSCCILRLQNFFKTDL